MAATAAAAIAVAGGTGAAVAATGGGSRASDFFDSVAKHLGVSPQKLEDATKAAAVDQVNADLAAGRITQAQADELKKRIAAGDVPLLGGGYGLRAPGAPGIVPGPGGPGFAKPFIGDGLAAAAKYLGLSESDLRTKLNGGQSLADVAKAQSKDVAGLQQAILDAEKADLDKAVADKKITQSQADDALSALKSRIGDLVNGTLRFGGRGGAGGGFPGGPGKPFIGDGLTAAAKYLGLSESDLRDKLSGGQSLADVAKAQSKDVAGLQQAILDAEKADLDKAVADKEITQAQADKVLSDLKSRVDDLVNAKGADHGSLRGRARRGAGPRFFFGP